MSTGQAFVLRRTWKIGAASFAEKSAEQLGVCPEYQPDFPRNSTNTFLRCDASMESPQESMGREREARRYRPSHWRTRAHHTATPGVRLRSAITVRHGREFARDIRARDRDTDCDSGRDRRCHCRCGGTDQLGMGDRLHRRHRGDLRLAADRRVDSRDVCCVRVATWTNETQG